MVVQKGAKEVSRREVEAGMHDCPVDSTATASCKRRKIDDQASAGKCTNTHLVAYMSSVHSPTAACHIDSIKHS